MLPHKIILKSIGIEIVLLILSSSLLSIPAIIFSIQVGEIYVLQHNLLTHPFFHYLNGVIFIITFIFFILSFLGIHLFKKYKNILYDYNGIFFILCLTWIFFGIGNYCIVASMSYLEPYFFLQYISFFIGAWLIGYLSFITPMGLGVREAVVTLGLSTIGGLPIALASALSLISRVILVVSELIFLFSIKVSIKLKFFSRISSYYLILNTSILTYILYFSYFTTQKHLNFFTGRFDLGNMDQTIWNTVNGRIFMLTNPDSTNIVSRLGTHADFILILLAPFYLLWQDPQMLLIIQTSVLACGGYFVFKLSEGILENKVLSLILALSYLFSPLVQRENLYDFHAVTLATTFLLGAFYYLTERRHVLFLTFLFLALLTKENVYLVGFFFGIYCICTKRKLIGIVLSIGSLVMFYLLVSKFIPMARGGEHFALSYFDEFGDSSLSVVKNIFLKPRVTISLLFTRNTFHYLIQLFSATGFTSFLSPFYMIFVGQDLAVNLLSKNENLKSINYQYTATLIPFIYISSIYGIKRLFSFHIIGVNAKSVSYYIAFMSIVSSWAYGVLPGSAYPSLEVFNNQTANKKEISEYLEHIPSRLSVASTNNIGAHLSHRENIYTIPNGIDKADIIVFLLTDEFAQPSLAKQRQMVESLIQDSRYKLIIKKGEFVVFRKR